MRRKGEKKIKSLTRAVDVYNIFMLNHKVMVSREGMGQSAVQV